MSLGNPHLNKSNQNGQISQKISTFLEVKPIIIKKFQKNPRQSAQVLPTLGQNCLTGYLVILENLLTLTISNP